MAKSNAERQAAYRAKRESERISEVDFKLALWYAYFEGRKDQALEATLSNVTVDAVYARTMDALAGSDLGCALGCGFDTWDRVHGR